MAAVPKGSHPANNYMKTEEDVNFIRIMLENRERDYLSESAQLSSRTRGREKPENECIYRTCYQKDRDKILHSKSFRRLKDKTQVYIRQSTDHIRVRLTHTLEVMQIARTIARALRLNEDLVEAIALGHDLGHTPFGHTGENVLNQLLKNGFRHSVQSLRVVDKLEKHGHGLNLCYEVREGIVKHSKKRCGLFTAFGDEFPSTMEAMVVKISDGIAYINHDLDDALSFGLLKEDQIPSEIFSVLGDTNARRIDKMVTDVIKSSLGRKEIIMSDRILKTTNSLRDFLFENVYLKEDEIDEAKKAREIVHYLFDYYMSNQDALFAEHKKNDPGDSLETTVADYISSMTDRYAVGKYNKLIAKN